MSRPLSVFKSGYRRGRDEGVSLRHLPPELLLEVFNHSAGKELKILRLVSRLFNELITPIFFRKKLEFSLKLPSNYKFCRAHGYYLYTGRVRACNPIDGILRPSVLPALVIREQRKCSFFKSPAADPKITEDARSDAANPIMGPIMHALRNGVLDVLPLAHELTIDARPEIPPTMRYASNRLAVYESQNVISFSERLPVIFEAATNLRVFHCYVERGGWDDHSETAAKLLKVVCRLCKARGIDLHVSLSVSGQYRLCIDSLSGLTSLELVIRNSLIPLNSLEQSIRELAGRCPRLNVPVPYKIVSGEQLHDEVSDKSKCVTMSWGHGAKYSIYCGESQ